MSDIAPASASRTQTLAPLSVAPYDSAITAVANAAAEWAKLGQTPEGQLTIALWRENGQRFLESLREGGQWIADQFKGEK